jgi:hypothetical protein
VNNLQITLWDYDPYESHSFLGEALVEMNQAQLNNQPFLYNLLDMDEENPIRMVGPMEMNIKTRRTIEYLCHSFGHSSIRKQPIRKGDISFESAKCP